METNPKQPADLYTEGNLGKKAKLAKLVAPPEPTNKDTSEPTIEGLHLFPKKVLDKLPEPYKSLIKAHRYETDQSALLLSLLVVGSGTLPGIYFYHGGKKYYPNMMAYHIGPAASGKGNASTARKVSDLIQAEYRIQEEKALAVYLNDLAIWKKAKKDARGLEPTKPTCPLLIYPDNTTKPKLIANLRASKGRGIILGQEADTSTQANKGEHGGFTDIWRQAAEHETITYGTKQDGNLEITNPQLAVLLTSTPGQVPGLIKSVEDGMISRVAFLYWPNAVGNKVQDPDGKLTIEQPQFEDLVQRSGKMIAQAYWERSDEDSHEIEFCFTKAQGQRSLAMTERYCKDIMDRLDRHSGSDKRAPIILKRIAMQLEVRRLLAEGLPLKSKTECSDWAFDLAMEIMETLWLNTLEVLDLVNKIAKNSKGKHTTKDQAERMSQMLSEGKTDAQISVAIWGDNTKRQRVADYRKAQNIHLDYPSKDGDPI